MMSRNEFATQPRELLCKNHEKKLRFGAKKNGVRNNVVAILSFEEISIEKEEQEKVGIPSPRDNSERGKKKKRGEERKRRKKHNQTTQYVRVKGNDQISKSLEKRIRGQKDSSKRQDKS